VRRNVKMGWIVLVSLLTLYSAWGSSAEQPTDLTKLSDDDLKTVTIHFERKGCYGTCPAYTIAIHGDGLVQYVGKAHVRVTGAQESHLDPPALRTLLAAFATAGFSSLPSEYSQQQCKHFCTDMATVVTQLDVKGTAHTVNHYYGCGGVPKELFALESQIDKAVDSEQWTGDVSEQGPFGTTCF
jgi:hypothetical protein